MKKSIEPELLQRFLNGSASPEEQELVNDWYASFESVDDDHRLGNRDESNRIREAIFAQIRRRMDEGTTRRVSILSSALRYAACLATILFAGIALHVFRLDSKAVRQELAVVLPASGFQTVTNKTGSAREQVLPDGSSVILKPRSSIEFPVEFNGQERNVSLHGEAFFDVSRDKDHPFVITTGDVMIKVLGTSFNVKAYENSGEISVSVKTGKVMVSKSAQDRSSSEKSADEEIVLTPNQEVVYNTIQELFEKKLIDQPEIVLSNPLVFEMKYDGTPVSQILGVLEANYGIEIEYDEQKLSTCSLTTTMVEEGFFERIEVICKAIGAGYTVQDSKVVITGSGCN